MKTYFLSLFLFFVTSSLFALDVSVYPAVFYEGKNGYVEMHYYFSGPSIGWKSAQDSAMQASAQVLITFLQDGKIIQFDKYNIQSPVVLRASDFRDLHRYSLKPGRYEVNIEISDLSREKNDVKFKTQINIQPPRNITISDLLLLSTLKKSDTETVYDKYGYYMEALPFNYLDKNTRNLTVYAEIYNTDQLTTDEYSLRIQFEQIDGSVKTPYQSFTKKRSTQDKDIYIKTMNAQFMPSGDYNLIIEVRDQSGVIITSNSIAFHRENPTSKKETTIADLNSKKGRFIEQLTTKELDYYLRALLAIISGDDKKILNTYFKTKNHEGKKQFMYSHFHQKDPITPSAPFYVFADIAQKVDKAYYSGFGHGFESDRGRIFLKYGAPNDQIKVEDEQFALPYEIWVYESLPNNGSGPIKFLFYNRDRAGENFILLHSNAREERQNRNWKKELFRDDTMPGFDYGNTRLKESEIDQSFNDHPNSMAIRYFQDL